MFGHHLGKASTVVALLQASLTAALPANNSPVYIDTNASVVVNQIVSTVTVGACGAVQAIGILGTTNPGYASISSASTVVRPIQSSSRAPTVLAPTLAPNVNQSDHGNLVPAPSAQLYYVQSATTGPSTSANSSIAIISAQAMNYPAVNIFQSSLISTLSCNANTASVTFKNQLAYQVAAGNWSASVPFIMITYHADCGDAYANGQHGFVLVNNIKSTSPGSLTIQLSITHVDFTQAVGQNNNVSVSIGSFSPSGNGTFNTTPSGNSTTAGNSTTSGFDDFDQTSDDSLGPYISLSNATKWTQLLPNMTSSSVSNSSTDMGSNDGFPSLESRKRSLSKRSIFDGIGDWFKKKIIDPVKDFVGNAVDTIEIGSLKALNVLDRFASVNKSISKQLSINQYPSNSDTPWGRAYRIYSNDKLQAYCVGCGVNGQVTISGTVIFSVANGVKEGSMVADGSLHGVLQIGLIAQQLSATIPIANQDLVVVSLSDFVIPGILKIGPTVKLGAGASLTVGASGKLLAGVTLDWPSVHASLNLAASEKGQANGFVPNLTPAFSADGSVSATLDAFLRASIGFQIGLLNIEKLTRSVELVDQPGLTVTASLSGSAQYANGQVSGQIGDASCAGVSISANVYNKVYANLAGISQYNLADWKSPSLNRCIKVGSKRDLSGQHGYDAGRNIPVIQPSRRGTPVVNTARALNVTSLANLASAPSPVQNDGNTGTAATTTYSVLSSQDGRFDIHWAQNGNLYAIASNDTTDSISDPADADSQFDTNDVTTQFATLTGSIILGDSDGRALHGYTDEINQYNLTRIRLHPPDAMPATAVLLSLRPAKDLDGGPDVLAAQDTAGNTYFPVMCVYNKLYPKILLASDPIAGATKLIGLPQITGPGVSTCGYISFAVDGI